MLEVKVDASALTAWASELSTRGMRNAIRRAVDQSARYARKVAIQKIAADIGVSASKIKAATPKVITTTAGDLSARWTVSKLRIGILDTKGARISKTGGLRASTYRETGGGSSSLDVANAFVVTTAAGGKFVAIRKSKARLPLKGIYAAHPATTMSQENAAPRIAWQKTADAELSQRLGREIQKQFFTEKLSASTPDIGD